MLTKPEVAFFLGLGTLLFGVSVFAGTTEPSLESDKREIVDQALERFQENVSSERLEIYQRFARWTVNSMAGIKNWKNLNEGQRGAIVTSIQAGIINVQPGGEGLKDEEVARRLSLFPKQTTKSLASISPKDLNQIAKRYESLAIDAKRYQEMCLKVVADHPVLLLDKKVNAAAAAMRGGFSEARRGLYWDTRDLSSPHDIGDLIRDFGRKTVEEAVVAHAQSAVFSMRPFYSIYAYPRVPYSGPLGKKKLASLKQYIEGRHMYKGVFVIINIRDFWHSIEMVANCLMGRRLPAKPFPIAQRQTALATQFKQISEYMSEAPDFVPLTFGGKVPSALRKGTAFTLQGGNTVSEAESVKNVLLPKRFKTVKRRALLGDWCFMMRQMIEDEGEGRKIAKRQFFEKWEQKVKGLTQFGGKERFDNVDLSELEKELLELYLEFEQLPFIEEHPRSTDEIAAAEYSNFLRNSTVEHARKARDLAKKLREFFKERAGDLRKTGRVYEVLFFRRVRYLMGQVRLDVQRDRKELTDSQYRELRRRISKDLERLKELGAFAQGKGPAEIDLQKLTDIQSAMLNYVKEARKHNPVLQDVSEQVSQQELRARYEEYARDFRGEKEQQAHERLVRKLATSLGKISVEDRVYHRAKLLINSVRQDICDALKDVPRKKQAKYAYEVTTACKRSLAFLKEEGAFDIQTNQITVETAEMSPVRRAMVTYLNEALRHNPVMDNLDKNVSRLQLHRLESRHARNQPQSEREAAQKLREAICKKVGLECD